MRKVLDKNMKPALNNIQEAFTTIGIQAFISANKIKNLTRMKYFMLQWTSTYHRWLQPLVE